MKSSEKGYTRLYNLLASRELTIGVLITLCIALAFTTITATNIFIWHIIRVLLVTVVINLGLCTIRRIKNLSRAVLIIHTGIIVTFIGGGIGTYGFVATVNIYEGSAVDEVYRWDIEKDVSIGVELLVENLHEEYYPVPVKVGVLKGQDKHGLYVLKTRESFDIDNYRVKVDSIEFPSKNLLLSIYSEDRHIGYADTSGNAELPDEFPFEFKLVAYIDPVIKKTWVHLKLINGSGTVAEGRTGVNSPLRWNGMNFHHTATNRDKSGRPFIGIQITKDPGLPFVYTGFGILAFGGTFYLLRRMRGLR